MVGLRPEEASSSQSVNSVFTESTTKTMACKKLRAILCCLFTFFIFKKHACCVCRFQPNALVGIYQVLLRLNLQQDTL